MSDPPSSSTAWPAARPTGISPIQHPAWEAARNAILDLAAEGPVTAIVVGEPGTGKTWLLRELAASLGDHGFPTMMLMQGNLPISLSSGAALLVDDAALMDAATRAEISVQQHGVVVLAATEWLEDDLDPAESNTVIIPLRPLQSAELADFAAEWLRRSGAPTPIDTHILSQLMSQSHGRVGLVVPLLREPAASWQPEAPLAETPPPIPRRPRSIYRPLLAVSAIAATIALGWALMPAPPPTKIAQTPAPSPLLAEAPPTPAQPPDTAPPAPSAIADATPAAAPPLPPLRHADTPDPALVTAATPAPPRIAAPPLVPVPSPELDTADIPVETEIPTPYPAIAAAPPPVLPTADPTVVATLEDPAATPAPPDQPQRNRPGGPGLVLVAQRGDTLQSLYGSVYRDRHAPSFARVLAANPGPFKPGAIVVFPEPPGGWQRLQH